VDLAGKPRLWARLVLWSIQLRDRRRLRGLMRRHPGLRVHPTASTNLAVAHFALEPGAVLEIGARVATERMPDRLWFHVEAGARVEIGEGSWLRCELEPIRLSAYRGAVLHLDRDCWLNGCQISAKQSVQVGEGGMIGPGTRVYDSDQHPIDVDTPEKLAPVRIGEFCWLASDVTVTRGSQIGGHCVIGSKSLVSGSIEPHSLAYGIPARVRGRVGRRTAFM
jgi:acetyltransferase-like isoleucine patch superfamily enzyme